MKTIKLINSRTGWLARYETDGQPDKQIISLFGSDTLPTAFTERALPMDVKTEIGRRNPGILVVFS